MKSSQRLNTEPNTTFKVREENKAAGYYETLSHTNRNWQTAEEAVKYMVLEYLKKNFAQMCPKLLARVLPIACYGLT